MKEEPVSLSCDVFSYGMVLLELLTCDLPFAGVTAELSVVGKIMSGEVIQKLTKFRVSGHELFKKIYAGKGYIFFTISSGIPFCTMLHVLGLLCLSL